MCLPERLKTRSDNLVSLCPSKCVEGLPDLTLVCGFATTHLMQDDVLQLRSAMGKTGMSVAPYSRSSGGVF